MVDMKFLLTALGLLMILEGMPYFISPAQMKKFLVTVLGAEDGTLRVMGFIIIALGLIVLYAAKAL